MKVLLIGPYPPPVGGISLYLSQLKEILINAGYVVMVLNTGSNKKIKMPGLINTRSSIDIFAQILKMDIDICHLNVAGKGHISLFYAVLFAAILRNKKIFLTIHSSNFFNYLSQVSGYKRLFSKYLLNHIDKYICVNDNIHNQAISLSLRPNDCSVIPAFLFQKKELKAQLSDNISIFLENHFPVLLTCGFIWPDGTDIYGLMTSIKLLSRLKQLYPNPGLIIACDDMSQPGNIYLNRIIELDLKKHVLLPGNLAHEYFINLLEKCDLFIRPTITDGDAISVREALALGTPVVASKTEFRPEGVVVFPIGDDDDFYNKVIDTLSNANIKKKIFIQSNFSNELLNIYHEEKG